MTRQTNTYYADMKIIQMYSEIADYIQRTINVTAGFLIWTQDDWYRIYIEKYLMTKNIDLPRRNNQTQKQTIGLHKLILCQLEWVREDNRKKCLLETWSLKPALGTSKIVLFLCYRRQRGLNELLCWGFPCRYLLVLWLYLYGFF